MDPIAWFLLTVVGAVALLLVFVPSWTRPEIYFAVTVVPTFRETNDGRRALALYRVVSLAASVLAALVVLLMASRPTLAPWASLATAVQLLGTGGGFLAARRLVLPHATPPSPAREAVIVPRRTTLPGGWPLQMLPFLIIGAAAAMLAVRWDALPARIPIHWNLRGQVDGWAARTPKVVLAPLLVTMATAAVMLALGVGLARGRRVRIDAEAAAQEQRFRRLTGIVLLLSELLIALTAVPLALVGLVPARTVGVALVVLLAGGVTATAVAVVRLCRLGQGGSRGLPDTDQAEPLGDRTPDSAWMWGLFYANRDDPALMVESRFGIGYTFNFAHPIAWVLLGLLLGGPMLVLWLLA